MIHTPTIRPGIIGPGEPGRRVFEGNFVLECPCGKKMHIAGNADSAERQRRDHARTGR